MIVVADAREGTLHTITEAKNQIKSGNTPTGYKEIQTGVIKIFFTEGRSMYCSTSHAFEQYLYKNFNLS
jgi:hypothetical protein